MWIGKGFGRGGFAGVQSNMSHAIRARVLAMFFVAVVAHPLAKFAPFTNRYSQIEVKNATPLSKYQFPCFFAGNSERFVALSSSDDADGILVFLRLTESRTAAHPS